MNTTDAPATQDGSRPPSFAERCAKRDAAQDIHTCSLYCDRPACIKAQRDEMREHYAAQLVKP